MSLRNAGVVTSDGLRLSLLLAPRRTPLDRGLGTFLALAFANLLLTAAWQWVLSDSPRMVNPPGFQSELGKALLSLIAAGVLCAIAQRRALFWTVACWLQAAALLPGVVTFVLCSLGGWAWAFAPSSWGILLAWNCAIALRLAWFVSGGRVWRSLAAMALAIAISVAPWLVIGSQWLVTTDWAAAFADDEYGDSREVAEPEATMYAQSQLLADAVATLQPQRPGRIDLYGLVFGSDGGQDVFRNEVDFVEQLLAERFDARGRVLGLVNHPDTADTRPLATATNLERGLAAIGEHMDPDEDVLFLYLTSHGSAEHEIHVSQPPLALDQLAPERLRAALDAAGIRWRVLVISACFSGGFIDALHDPQTLVVTAARADRSSFGCEPESDVTWFGNAFMVEALNRTTDLREAFDLATATIAEREAEQEFEASEPQWDEGERILEQWRRGTAQWHIGSPVPFAPDGDSPAPSP